MTNISYCSGSQMFMTQKRKTSALKSVIYLLLVSLLGCKSTEMVQNSSQETIFEASNLTTDVLLEATKDLNDLHYFNGKGRLYYRSEGESERLSIEYEIDAEGEVYSLRNRLGIPVADIQMDADSILFIDRIQEKALQWHKDNPPLSMPGMVPPLRLYELIHYPNWLKEAVLFEQSKTQVRATIPEIGYVYLDSDNFSLIHMNYKNEWELDVQDRKNYKNSMIGRTFQLQNNERNTQILVQLIEFEWQTVGRIQELSIPKTYEKIIL